MDMTLFDERMQSAQTTAEDHAFIRDFISMTARLVASKNIDSMREPGQTPVEDWVLAAIEALIQGHTDTARAIFARFDEAEWDSGPDHEPDPSLFLILWREDHFSGEHVAEADPNCVACPLGDFPVIRVAVMPGRDTAAATA